jgi:hypothetical protein
MNKQLSELIDKRWAARHAYLWHSGRTVTEPHQERHSMLLAELRARCWQLWLEIERIVAQDRNLRAAATDAWENLLFRESL